MVRRKIDNRVPRYTVLIEPTFDALKYLGGSGTIQEICNTVAKSMNLADEVVDLPHAENSTQSEFEYQLAWARTYLKYNGLIQNSARGIWSIAPNCDTSQKINVQEILKRTNWNTKDKPSVENNEILLEKAQQQPDDIKTWKVLLLEVLLKMNPFAFERLAQRLLRECGFSQVEVTRKTGDGGIDGTGKLKINGIFSFNVAFQCKRYQGVVGAPEIRDFRGSLTTHVEKGVFITTGTFSKAARDEASNEAKQQIDLIDGDDFIEKLAEYSIGVKEIKDYEIDEKFFMTI